MPKPMQRANSGLPAVCISRPAIAPGARARVVFRERKANSEFQRDFPKSKNEIAAAQTAEHFD
jgi:hypothetical protein